MADPITADTPIEELVSRLPESVAVLRTFGIVCTEPVNLSWVRGERAEMPMMAGARRGEQRRCTRRYGGTGRTPSPPASAARSALAAEANWGCRVECGEPVWGTLGEAAADKGISDLSPVLAAVVAAARPAGGRIVE